SGSGDPARESLPRPRSAATRLVCRRASEPDSRGSVLETAGDMTTRTAQTSVSPELSVRRGREALEFYKAAFGAVEIYRVGERRKTRTSSPSSRWATHPSGFPTSLRRTRASAPNRWAEAPYDCC